MLLKLDWRALAEAGVSIYVLTKLGAASNVEFLELEGAMRGMSKQQFVDFLKQQAQQNKASRLAWTKRKEFQSGEHRCRNGLLSRTFHCACLRSWNDQ